MDPIAIEHMFQFEYDDWNQESEERVAKTIFDAEKKDSFKLYLQSNPTKTDSKLVKEFMVEQMRMSG